MTCPYCETGKSERQVVETWDFFHSYGVDLTRQQVRIMAELLSKQGAVRTESIIGALWYDAPNGEPEYAENIIKVHISKVRKKIAEANMPFQIKPIWGIGYQAIREVRSAEHSQGKVLKSIAVSLIFMLLCAYPFASFIS